MAHPAKPGKATEIASRALAGLDQEPQIVDTTRAARRAVVEHDAETLRRPAKQPENVRNVQPDDFGEDFEEIG